MSRKYVYRPKIDKGIPYGKLFAEEGHYVETLKAIKRAGYYQFDVDEMIVNQEVVSTFASDQLSHMEALRP